MHRLLLLSIFVAGYVSHNALAITKRQTFYYPEELKKYARPHSGTKFYQGTVGRYAPQEWPAWYTRTIFRWDGNTRMGPYHPNDVRYLAYQRSRFQN